MVHTSLRLGSTIYFWNLFDYKGELIIHNDGNYHFMHSITLEDDTISVKNSVARIPFLQNNEFHGLIVIPSVSGYCVFD